MTFFILTLAVASVAMLALRKRHGPDDVIELDESDIWADVPRQPPPPPPRRAPALGQHPALVH
ncbi:MAG: hypothetical protein ABI591_34275 [Kofleriaceae bacterium]